MDDHTLPANVQPVSNSMAYTNDDMGRFHFDAASMVKFLIRARRQVEPDFIIKSDLQRWRGAEPPENEMSCADLLQRALDAHGHILKHITLPSRSSDEQRQPSIEELVYDFVDSTKLKVAVNAARGSRRVKWATVAQWDKLNAIRDGLDKLPDPVQIDEPVVGWWTFTRARDYVENNSTNTKSASASFLNRLAKKDPSMRRGTGINSRWNPVLVEKACEGLSKPVK